MEEIILNLGFGALVGLAYSASGILKNAKTYKEINWTLTGKTVIRASVISALTVGVGIEAGLVEQGLLIIGFDKILRNVFEYIKKLKGE